MAVYVFNLIAGFVLGGIDSAQGYRAKMLENTSFPVRYIFVETPTRSDIMRHGKNGIRMEQMLDIHQMFTDNQTLELYGNAQEKARELQTDLHCTGMKRRDGRISLVRNGSIHADILLDEADEDSFYAIHYYRHGNLVRTEMYTDGIAYTNYYMTAKSESGLYAKLVKRTFCNQDGTSVYDQIYENGQEWNIFPDGRRYTKQQLLAECVRKLDLGTQDVIIVDRPARYDLLQPIFQFKKETKLILVAHSRHYYEKGENPDRVWFNQEYDYCFKYSRLIDTIVVSTEEQKSDLIKNLRDYGQNVPEIAVIPAGGIERLHYPDHKRRPYSLITVSRIARQKRIDWIIKSVIKANRVNDKIPIDIFGADDGYLPYMQELIVQNQAQSYIRLMGWADVTELYKNYEVYLSASLEETFGLTLLEAAASGTAMIGLDVKYGNRLFIRSEKNGYLIGLDDGYLEGNEEKITDAMAEKIIEIFQDEKRLERFHQGSYEIAGGFDEKIIEKKWKKLLGE